MHFVNTVFVFGVMMINICDNLCSPIQPLDSNHHFDMLVLNIEVVWHLIMFLCCRKKRKYVKQTTPFYWRNNTAECADNAKCNM